MVFVKWFGSKQRYLDKLIPHFPSKFNQYHEPFLGSGSVYFYLKNNGILDGKTCYLSDKNHELICAFLSVANQDRLDKMYEILEEFREKCSPKFTKELKEITYSTIEEVAARFLYLNRVCFSGLYRLNSDGNFNVPHKKEKPSWITYGKFLESFELLNDPQIKIFSTDYSLVLNKVGRGDLVYFDPPYASEKMQRKAPMYASKNWEYADYKRLRITMDVLTDMGVKCVHSNSNTVLITELFDGYEIDLFDVNYKPAAGESRYTSELIIKNF